MLELDLDKTFCLNSELGRLSGKTLHHVTLLKVDLHLASLSLSALVQSTTTLRGTSRCPPQREEARLNSGL